jgi:hypothetical protein
VLFASPSDSMRDSELLLPSPARLLLDFGLDEQTCEAGLFMDERGMRFIGRWQFSLGTQLSVVCESHHPILGRVKVRVEGMVVWSERVARSTAPAFDTTVLFLDLPDELKQSVRDFSLHLE